MPLVSSAIKSIIDGVSQQPDALRLQSQGDEQINGLSSEVDGLRKRPPTDFITKLEDADDWADAYKFIIERDEGTKYICLLRSDPAVLTTGFTHNNDTIRIYDLDGNRKQVGYRSQPDGTDLQVWDDTGANIVNNLLSNFFEFYMSDSDAASLPSTGEFTTNIDKFRHQTIGDYTFVTNRNRRPVLNDTLIDYDGVPTAAGDVAAIVNVKQNFNGQEYRVDLTDFNGVSIFGSHTVGDTNPSTLNEIASGIVTGLQSAPSYGALEYTVEAVNNLVLVRLKNNPVDDATALANQDDLKVAADGPAGRNGMVAIKNSVAKFSDLPELATPYFRVKVAGLDNDEENDYWVEYVPETTAAVAANELVTGSWVETTAPAIPNVIRHESMPFAIIRNPDDTFSISRVIWDSRETGDEDSVPAPSFLGSYLQQQTGADTGVPIMDIVFYQSRLGFITKENIVLSETANYFDFFAATATEILDTDPIDLSASHSQIVNLHSAVTYNRSLVLFSDQAQFRLTHNGDLSATSLPVLTPTTEYESPNRVKPVHAGTTLLYPTERGRWSGMNEMFLSPEGDNDVVADVSNQVPRYIDGRIEQLDSSAKETLAAMVTSGTDDLYVYKYFYSGTEKLQSSWSRWQFHFKPSAVLFADDVLHILGVDGDDLKLFKMPLERALSDYNLPYQVHLDAKELVTGVFDGTYTSWTLDTDCTQGTVIGVNLDDTSPEHGYAFDLVEVVDADTVRVLGDFSSVPHVFGKQYTFRYKFTQLYVRDGNGVPISTGRLQLRRGTLTHGPSGYYKVIVANSYGDPIEVEYSGRVVDDPFPDEVSIREGIFSFPMIGRSDLAELSVETDSHLPSSILELEWEGFYHRRNQRT